MDLLLLCCLVLNLGVEGQNGLANPSPWLQCYVCTGFPEAPILPCINHCIPVPARTCLVLHIGDIIFS